MFTLGAAQGGFGRFGYVDSPSIPGFNVDKEGFVSKFGAADKFYFSEAAPEWKVASVSEHECAIDLGMGAGPTRLSINQFAPGFMLNFSKGFALRFRTSSSPFLSWKEASVGEKVPTPAVRWVAVSFKIGQPPVVLGFLDKPVSLQIEGQVGDWTLKTLEPYTGWVRVGLPMGTRALATDSAATLGRLSATAAALDSVWWQPAPKLKAVRIASEDTAVEATWEFDRKGVVVPVAAAMARLGKYPLSILSKTRRLEGELEDGPQTICEEDRLTMRFPVVRVPLGRAITVGSPAMEPIGTVSAFDLSGIVELGFENLIAARDLRTRATAEAAFSEFIQGAQYVAEPHTGQQLPYAANGVGIDLVAAHALLHQAYTMSTRPTSTDNALLTSVSWRRDWYTWRIWTDDAKVARRAAALAAIAGALCSEPERRLEAAMLQAGLAAERGVGIYFARQSARPEPKFIEPMETVRNTIFFMEHTPRRPSPFAATLLSGLRIFGDTPVRCVVPEGGSPQIEWAESVSITLASGFVIRGEGDGLSFKHVLGYSTITAPNLGPQVVRLTLPAWAPALPAFVPPPRYTEPEL